MKILFQKLLIVGTLFVFISCTENQPVAPFTNDAESLSSQSLLRRGNSEPITVMTRNIYVGADVDAILQAEDPNQVPLIVAQVFQSMIATNFSERAEALAKEISKNQPDLIGLQEVSLIRMQSPGDAVLGGVTPAENVVIDQLQILIESLNALGLDYDVVAKVENSDVEMPMVVSAVPEFDDVRLTDYDVILAKRGIEVSNIDARNFKAKIVIPEMGLELPRGYVAVTANVNGKKYRFVNTHLEDADQGGDLLKIQLAQAAELMLRLDRVRIPVILVGDFNSAAPNELTYRLITSTHRYQDTWIKNTSNNNPDGFTYGHDLDLRNSTSNFWKRIDYVFFRNGMHKRKYMKLKEVKAEVVGNELKDRKPSGLWPSDHGGVVTEMQMWK